MDISVVIPTQERPALVRATLEALERQSLPGRSFEVILVDDGSSPQTRRSLRRLAPPFRFRLLETRLGGLASARNLGASHAAGDLLLFLDDDICLAPESLGVHLETHTGRREPVAAVGALDFPPDFPPSAFLHYLKRIGHYDVYKDPDRYPSGWPPVPPVTGNTSMLRSVFDKVGGYDTSFKHYGGEDLEMGYRLHLEGVPIVYIPRAFGHHHHPKDFRDFCKDMEAAGESLIQVYRKHPGIRVAKKIDVIEDTITALPGRKKLIKAILSTSLAFPGLMDAARRALELGAPHSELGPVLVPFFRWVAHYHYALGMRRGLTGRS